MPPLEIERWGVALHHSLSARARDFHSYEHVLDLVRPDDPLETIAALYHDTVYVQVDLCVPPYYEALLDQYIQREDAGWRILPKAASDPLTRDVLAVFAREAGQLLGTSTGLNELASALVVAKEFERVLSRTHQIAIAACIEATIPFRDFDADGVCRRLKSIGVVEDDASRMVRRAIRLANNDVGNFGDVDPARFLDNTWKLLPETTPSLHTPETYVVSDYRIALQKMEGFLSVLPAERVFRSWGGEPAPEEHQRRLQATKTNVDLAVRYLRCRLYAIAMIEALAAESGGDAPLDYFMGGLPDLSAPRLQRIEQFLPKVTSDNHDPSLVRLLQGSRSASFDFSPSALALFFLRAMGEPAVMEGVVAAKKWWNGSISARHFLSQQPKETTVALAKAASHIADARSDLLSAIADRF